MLSATLLLSMAVASVVLAQHGPSPIDHPIIGVGSTTTHAVVETVIVHNHTTPNGIGHVATKCGKGAVCPASFLTETYTDYATTHYYTHKHTVTTTLHLPIETITVTAISVYEKPTKIEGICVNTTRITTSLPAIVTITQNYTTTDFWQEFTTTTTTSTSTVSVTDRQACTIDWQPGLPFPPIVPNPPGPTPWPHDPVHHGPPPEPHGPIHQDPPPAPHDPVHHAPPPAPHVPVNHEPDSQHQMPMHGTHGSAPSPHQGPSTHDQPSHPGMHQAEVPHHAPPEGMHPGSPAAAHPAAHGMPNPAAHDVPHHAAHPPAVHAAA